MPGPNELLILFLIAGTGIILTVLTVVPFWFICQKAGFPAWYALATLVPVLNIAFMFFLAFEDWPALRGTAEQHKDARR